MSFEAVMVKPIDWFEKIIDRAQIKDRAQIEDRGRGWLKK